MAGIFGICPSATVRINLICPQVDSMNGDQPVTAGVEEVDATPMWEATGDREIRARGVHPRHMKLLALLREDLGGVSNGEAVAALLEYYYRHPDRVVDFATGPHYR